MLQDAATSHVPALNMEECGVCYQDYGADRQPHPLSSCRHALCGSCLQQLESQGAVKCPFCRAHSQVPVVEVAGKDGSGDVTRNRAGPMRWLKRLCGKARAGSRRQGTLAKEDIRDLALMSSYFL